MNQLFEELKKDKAVMGFLGDALKILVAGIAVLVIVKGIWEFIR